MARALAGQIGIGTKGSQVCVRLKRAALRRGELPMVNLSLRTRRQLLLAGLVACLVSLVLNLLTGHVFAAVVSAVFTVSGGWLLIRLRTADERPAPTASGQDSPRTVVKPWPPVNPPEVDAVGSPEDIDIRRQVV